VSQRRLGNIIKWRDDTRLGSFYIWLDRARNVFNRTDTSQKVTLVLTRDSNEIKLQLQPTPIKGVPGAKTLTPVPPDLFDF
jgi:hypothetical protein